MIRGAFEGARVLQPFLARISPEMRSMVKRLLCVERLSKGPIKNSPGISLYKGRKSAH